MTALVERLHARAWATAATMPVAERLRRDRGARVVALAVAHVVGALALTALGPLWLLLLGPLLLGVPHVAADLRHLAVRPPRPLPRGMLLALSVPFGAMTALRGAAMLGFGVFTEIELGLGASAIAVAALWGRGRPFIQGAIVLATAALLVPALLSPGQAALLLGHAHNLVAIALWTAFMGARAARWVVPAVVAACCALILGGALDPIVLATGALEPAAGLDLDSMIRTLAPDLPAPWDLRLVLAFALLQAVHYSLWIWCIPATPAFAPGEAPEGPSAAWRRWWTDLGPPLAVGVVVAAIALPAAGLFAPAAVRAGYLSIVLFHGWLELAIAAHFLVLRRAAG